MLQVIFMAGMFCIICYHRSLLNDDNYSNHKVSNGGNDNTYDNN